MTNAASKTGGEEPAQLQAKIGGMSCSFCAETIRKAYGRMEGVGQVNVSLAHEEALVHYDPAKIGEAQSKETLRYGNGAELSSSIALFTTWMTTARSLKS